MAYGLLDAASAQDSDAIGMLGSVTDQNMKRDLTNAQIKEQSAAGAGALASRIGGLAGQAAGTYFGGPAGGAAGSELGSIAGSYGAKLA